MYRKRINIKVIRFAATPAIGMLGFVVGSLFLIEIGTADDKTSGPAPVVQESSALSFEKHIAPIFAAKCTSCHGKDVQKSELDLSTPEGVRKGGGSGEAFVAHKPDESLLYQYVESGEMPPEKIKDPAKRLTEAEIKTIHDWIATGATFATTADPAALAKAESVTEDEVIPMMLLHCTVCHGARKREAGLDLRTRESMLVGGRSGPVVVPGHPEESLILKRIQAAEMPPSRKMFEVSVKPVEPGEIELLTKWISQGAPVSTKSEDVAGTGPDLEVSDEDRQFWSFQSPKPVAPPRPRDAERVRNPIDAFVLEKLEAAGLEFSPEADLRTLARRAYFDLTGLPPKPEELQQVLADPDPNVYEKLIDRLLESQHYGERWGRYWLDLAGYADSEGKTDQDLVRPFAYRYRDYVIRAFNADKRYDRFLMEQLAGDELADYENASEITPEIYDNLVATGFLRMVPDGTFAAATSFVQDRMLILADDMQVVGSSVMGLTIHCARCHDHKFDPIPHRDYYRMLSVFKPALDEHDWLPPNVFAQANNTGTDLEKCRYLPHVLPSEAEPVKAHNGPLLEQIATLERKKEDAAKKVKEQLLHERLSSLPDKDREMLAVALETSAEDRNDMQRITIDAMTEQLNLDDQMLRQNPEYDREATAVDKQVANLKKKLQQTPLIRAAWDRGAPSPTYILHRGEASSPLRRVGPGVLSVLTNGRTPFEVAPPWPEAKTTGRRLAFAKWLIKPDHPLTSRVMANRIWLHHFGRGLVETADNFGEMGTRPSHPELLDWLAIEFIQRGWSIKSLHRLMMTSSTYRQSSHVGEKSLELDPDNKLLSRMPLRRLEAEAVRDSILLTAGRLDTTQFGPPDNLDVRADGLVTVREAENGWRRSIYTLQRRTAPPTLLESFDLPQMLPNCVGRANSTVAPQALQLLNDGQVHSLSKKFAARVLAESGDDPQKQVDRTFMIALGRLPNEGESQSALSALKNLTSQWLEHQQEIAIESTAELWIHERRPDKVYEDDLIYVWSSRSRDKARRSGLVEFDLKGLPNRPIEGTRLELAIVEESPRFRQQASLVPPGIEGLNWKKYQAEKAPEAQSLESLGSYDANTKAGTVGNYRASNPASDGDLQLLKSRIAEDGRVALVLTAVEDGKAYQADWDDSKGLGTSGKRPRLMIRIAPPENGQHSELERQQAQLADLSSFCHALLNSAEFVYVD